MSTTFRERLRNRMEELDLSQADLARKAGCQQAAICQYLSGERQPDFEHIISLADALEVTTDFLLGKAEYDTSCFENDNRIREMADNFWELPLKQQEALIEFGTFLQSKYPDPKEVPCPAR